MDIVYRLALIFILNLHVIHADFLRDIVTAFTMPGIRPTTNGTFVLPDVQRSTHANPHEMITRENYPAETHHVTTEDGYILTVFRIRGPPGSTAVFLQHGLLCSSSSWLLLGRGKSLAYILADHGYDVWLGNARGTTYSKKHEKLSTSDPKYWDFSWDELVIYDLPAVITYITDLKQDSLFYIGHSMGASHFSAMATKRPDVAKRVRAMIGFAPAIYVYHIRAAVKLIAPFWKQFQRISNSLGIYEFLPRSLFFDAFAKYVCETRNVGDVLCSNPMFLIAGFDPAKLNYKLLPKIWSYFPAGTSIKLFTHWLQQMVVNEFRSFDYGLYTNIKMYNRTKPPLYDLSKFGVPSAVFYSPNDWLVGAEDTRHFYNQIPSKLGIFEVEDKNYNHFDFLWAVDVHKLIYSKIIGIFTQHGNNITARN